MGDGSIKVRMLNKKKKKKDEKTRSANKKE